MKKMKLFLVIICIALIFGCSTNKPLYKDSSFKEPMKIAVLPFENETTDLAAGELLRLFFIIGMDEKGYEVQSFEITDKRLKMEGITDGGQLGSISSDSLLNILEVDGLIYGTLIEAKYSTLAVVSTKKVTANIELIGKNNTALWKDQGTSKEGALGNITNPLQGLAEQVVDKAFEKAFAKYKGHPLEVHIENVAYILQNKMPGKRVEVSGWN
jgi:hypothetical protein